jgi:hypothetical protein
MEFVESTRKHYKELNIYIAKKFKIEKLLTKGDHFPSTNKNGFVTLSS